MSPEQLVFELAELKVRVYSLEAAHKNDVKTLTENTRMIVDDVGDLKVRVGSLELAHQQLVKNLNENTEITREIRDGMIAVKTVRKFALFVAPLLASIVAGWAWIKDHLK